MTLQGERHAVRISSDVEEGERAHALEHACLRSTKGICEKRELLRAGVVPRALLLPRRRRLGRARAGEVHRLVRRKREELRATEW